MKDKKYTRRGGYYWVDEQPLVSVTNVLKIIDKPAIRFWYGQQIYRAFAANPSLSEKDAMSAPYRVSGKAKSRGTTVHSIVETYKKQGDPNWAVSLDQPWRNYASAFERWVSEYNVNILRNEATVFSRKHGYAGTLDILATVGSSKIPIIIDVKTGKDIYPEAFLQLSAYHEAVQEMGKELDGIAVLLLHPDGGYKYSFTKEIHIEIFLAAKKIWDWQHKKDVEQMKLYKKKS